jgi:formylglycine-generating enzyme required for sulfatase activity
MALVHGSFCIDKWEGSLVEVTPSGERPFSAYECPEGKQVRAVSRPGVVPQAYISRNDATAACGRAGKRLCREEEWVEACKGDPPATWPYGNDHLPGACNDTGVAPLHKFYPEAPGTYTLEPMNDPRLNQVPGTVTKTGDLVACTNAFDVFDMVGNLHEWVMSHNPTFRGGYYQDVTQNGPGCDYQNVAHGAHYHDYSTGFRCCADRR